MGGNNPITLNNTYAFEKIGWTGVVFEPIPVMQKKWEKERSAKFFPYAITNKDCTLDFTVVEGQNGWEDMLSFVNADLSHFDNLDVQLKK